MKLSKLTQVSFLLAPIFLYGIGGGLNQLVCLLNHNMMPVEIPEHYKLLFPSGSQIDESHVVANNETVLRVLDDRIQLQGSLNSIGDEFIDFGTLLAFPFLGVAAIGVAMQRENKKLVV